MREAERLYFFALKSSVADFEECAEEIAVCIRFDDYKPVRRLQNFE